MRREKMILLVVCLLMSRLCLSQVKSSTVFPSIVVGKTVTIESQFSGLPVVEPHLSTHPSDPLHLLAAAMIVTDIQRPYQSCRLSSFVSKDGGISWTETTHDYWGYDPWTAILPNGQTAMGWLGTPEKFRHQFPIQFFSSSDGGVSWNRNVQTFPSPHGHDGVKITGLKNQFYFTTVRFKNDMSADVVVYQRTDDGPFQEVTKVNSLGLRLNFCEPVILSDGTVLIPSSHYLRKAWVQRYDPATGQLSDKSLMSIRPGGNRGYMRLTADNHANSPFNDRVYFVRATNGVWLNYSKDKGQTWSNDIRVDHFKNGKPGKAMVSSVAINKNGVLAVSWVDSQHDPDQQKNDLYMSISMDGGLNFCPPLRVTDVSSDPKTSANGDVANKFPGGGHYLNLADRADGSFQLIWSDSRNGVFELQTCRVTLAHESKK